MRKYAYLFLALLLVSIVSSAPSPFISTSTQTGIEISYRPIETLKLGEDYRVHLHVYNRTAGGLVPLTNTTTSCYYHLYNRTGFDIDLQNLEFESYNNIDFAKTIKGTNFSYEGMYTIILECDTSGGITTYETGSFYVTSTGKIAEGTTQTTFIILFMIIIMGMLSSMLYNLFRLLELKLDAKDLIISVSLYFGLLAYYILFITYAGNVFMERILIILIPILGVTNVLIPLIAFLLGWFKSSTEKMRRSAYGE